MIATTEPSVATLARAAMAKGMEALAAGDHASAIAWLERAHRLVPNDPNAMLSLAGALLTGQRERAANLFQRVAERYDVRQAWMGLATARILLGQSPLDVLAKILSRHALTVDTEALADRISHDWCGLRPDGTVIAHGDGPMAISLDGAPVPGRTLPAGWESARAVEVTAHGRSLLGSPIQIAAIRRLAGCVEARDGGIDGWAWYPNDPDTAPVLTISRPDAGWERTLVADAEGVAVADTGPLARPRRFRLNAADLPGPGLVHLRGPNGMDIAGSPLDPLADQTAHVAAALWLARTYAAMPALRADAPVPSCPSGMEMQTRPVTIVIPVHNGGTVVADCLNSVLAARRDDTGILVVDDGSRDPTVIALLDELAGRGRIALLRHKRALGFPGAANAGLRAAPGHDVVLLNSDTLVPPGWLERLRTAAYSASDIGTVTPFSNDASIVSYPGAPGTNPRPDQMATTALDRLARKANGNAVTDIPVGVGFCLYLRRDCLDATGLFRDDLFAQGYGEENEFCMRARRLGWRHVALPGLFVAHIGQASFGPGAVHLRARNARLLEQLHPGYDALVARFGAADPLADARRRIDLMIWRDRSRDWNTAAVLVTHNHGGGVERRLSTAIRAHRDAGRRPIVLRPAKTAAGEPAIALCDGADDDLPNLIHAVPRELPALLRLLRATRPEIVEVHHLAAFDPAIYRLIQTLGAPYDVHVHDYAWVCPRISMVAGQHHYCGEPALHECEACVTDHGSYLAEAIGVAALRERSEAFLTAARRVIVPSDDTRRRLRRYFGDLGSVTVQPHGSPVLGTPAIARPDKQRVCVAGAIGVHKGYYVLLACARDAARRGLDLEFIVVGHTIDDARLLETGAVFVTGEYSPDEASRLILQQNATIGFVPSVSPETWCLALDELWYAGLHTAAFDIGAPAERIRAAGHGFLLPLGLSATAINNSLVAAIRTSRHW